MGRPNRLTAVAALVAVAATTLVVSEPAPGEHMFQSDVARLLDIIINSL